MKYRLVARWQYATVLCSILIFSSVLVGCGDSPVSDTEPEPEMTVNPGIIEGQVTPIEGIAIQVRLLKNDEIIATTDTDPDGSYGFRDVEPGDYTVEATAAEYEQVQQRVTVVADQVVQVGEVTLEPLALPVAQLRGVVVDQASKDALLGAQVRLVGADGEAYQTLSGEAGVFEFVNLPVGQGFSLSAEFEGYDVLERTVDPLDAGEQGKIEIQLLAVFQALPLGQGLAIGTVAPNFTLVDGDGNEHMLTDYRDQKIILHFNRGSW